MRFCVSARMADGDAVFLSAADGVLSCIRFSGSRVFMPKEWVMGAIDGWGGCFRSLGVHERRFVASL